MQNNDQLDLIENFDEAGFVFVPFEVNGKKVLFSTENSNFLEFDWKNEIEFIETDVISKVSSEQLFSDKQVYERRVEHCINYIKESACNKIVLSRKQMVHFKREEVFTVFNKLIFKYPSAFCYLWFHPEIGCWMGASPEKLIKTENNLFETMSLAGTQKFKGSMRVKWQEKEREEQQLVTDYIVDVLGSLVTSVSQPFTSKAGGLLHICSMIRGEMDDMNDLKLLIERLHPTPAVCGLPKDLALDFLHKYEGYDREFYSGFLGELNMGAGKCSAELFVNLRCMQIFPEQVAIYVGGGITSKSSAKKEWEETVAKTMTMRSVLS
ncbi:chorismate-binding protein [Namhaeicola litoreus]|uniref:isochorismate synthase n=1 Tax=Namhaeicola litoreus TaxID=1052145 RepID=A0ABW3Y1C5_9FLAO